MLVTCIRKIADLTEKEKDGASQDLLERILGVHEKNL